jgi:hypothetical protein
MSMSSDRTVQEYLVRMNGHRTGLLGEDDLAVACIQHHWTHWAARSSCSFCDYSWCYWLLHCDLCDISHTKEIAKYLQEMSQTQVSFLFRSWIPWWHIAWMRYCARFGMWARLQQSLRHLARIEREKKATGYSWAPPAS